MRREKLEIEPSPCKSCTKDRDTCTGRACMEWKSWFRWHWAQVCHAVRDAGAGREGE